MKLPMGNDVTIMLDPNSSSPNNMRIATVKNIEARSNNKESDADAETKKKLDGIKMQQETFSQKLIREYLPTLNKEISSTIALLKKAYSANIIPLQFRNIEGVYYLYDYLSTSNQSLSEALMQANLEAIKSKLDNMIKLQSAQIIQQAQTNARLDNIQAQNQRLQELSEATMNNTAVAAKYAQIAAVNAEVSLKLQAQQLAYQKAEFWLK